jgi:AcrR family transcriptional regulator
MTPSNKSESSRNAILDVAQTLFIHQGYAATSMRQMAKNTGLALSGIYNHFPSKEDIFQTVLIECDPCQYFFRSLAPGNLDREAFQTLLAELSQHPDFINLVLIEIVEFQGKHLPKIFEGRLGDVSPPASWHTFLSMAVSYHISRLLLGESQSISKDAFMDYFLKPE